MNTYIYTINKTYDWTAQISERAYNDRANTNKTIPNPYTQYLKLDIYELLDPLTISDLLFF